MSLTITGPFDLGTLPGGSRAVALGCSSDGSVIVGYSDDASTFFQAFRWDAINGMVGLGYLPGDVASVATCVSGDGSVIAGYSQAIVSASRGFRWSAIPGMTALGGGAATQAFAITKDGVTIVGASGTTFSTTHLFSYTVGGGLSDKGSAPHATGGTYGTAVSNDGGTITGGNGGATGGHAFVWRAGGPGFTDLGKRTGANWSGATGITGDGVTMCGADGFGSLASELEAWTVTIAGVYDDSSFPLNDVNPNSGATCITPDGTSMAGVSELLVGQQSVAWYGTTQFGGFVQLGLPQLSGGLGSSTKANAISDDGLVVVGQSKLFGDDHAVYWLVNSVTPPTPPDSPVPLPCPMPYPMPKVPPQVICIASGSHAAGMFYGPHVDLPRA